MKNLILVVVIMVSGLSGCSGDISGGGGAPAHTGQLNIAYAGSTSTYYFGTSSKNNGPSWDSTDGRASVTTNLAKTSDFVTVSFQTINSGGTWNNSQTVSCWLTTVYTGTSLCSAIGVSIDWTGGTLTLADTNFYADMLALPYTLSGSLKFTPP